MVDKVDKAMILGIDAPIVSRLYRWAIKGELPVLGKLIAEGIFAKNCLPPFPTITPPGWTTIATGAWPGTHGITDFEGHLPGQPLDETYQNFDARLVQAEPLWKAAERAGKRSIVLNYPTTWKAELQDGYLVGGFGLHINDWRFGVAREDFLLNDLAEHILIATEPYPFATEAVPGKARGWEGIEHSPKALEAQVSLLIRKPLHEMAPVVWHLLVDDVAGKGYDTVLIAKSKNKADVFARLSVGEWTPNIYDTFETEVGPKKGVFRVKLVELSRDASQLRLFVPGLCALNGWAVPASLEDELDTKVGLPSARSPYDAWLMGWIDNKTLVETADQHNVWLSEAAKHLMSSKPWDLFFTHVHTPDSLYHAFSAELDPLTAKEPQRIPEFEQMELDLYKSVDRCLGEMLTLADDKTLVVVTSDHGAVAASAEFHAETVLEQAGLLKYLPASEGQRRKVDWGQTKAAAQRYVHIYVNTKGRDPQGVVEAGAEYERVREAVIKALYEYTDPKTRRKPIALALRREDARVIGLQGDRVGDIVYAIDPHFGMEHGYFLPTATFGIGSMQTLCIMAGPGVKRGATIERTVWLTDIVPTVCYLAELPVPAQCEGAVLYQALEDPEARTKELRSLRRKVEQLKRMGERPPMC